MKKINLSLIFSAILLVVLITPKTAEAVNFTASGGEIFNGIYNYGNFIVPNGVQTYVQGTVNINAANISVLGTINGDGRGGAGGAGDVSTRAQCWCYDCAPQSGNPCEENIRCGPGGGRGSGPYPGAGALGSGTRYDLGGCINKGAYYGGGGGSTDYTNFGSSSAVMGSGGGGGNGGAGYQGSSESHQGGNGGNGGKGGAAIILQGERINISGSIKTDGEDGYGGGWGNQGGDQGTSGGGSGGGGGSAGGITISYTHAQSSINLGSLSALGGTGGPGGEGGTSNNALPSNDGAAGASGEGGMIKIFGPNPPADTSCEGKPVTSSCIYIDAIPPIVAVTGAPADWTDISQSASVSCVDSDSGCDADTYKLYASITPLISCPTNYNSYNLLPPFSVSNHLWICAAAKDNAGNTGFSAPVEFKVATTSPPFPPSVLIDTAQAANSCISGSSTTPGLLNISWINPMDPILYVDISSDPDFDTNAYHKAVSGNSTTGPDGFGGYTADVQGDSLILLPDTPYYFRLWNGNNGPVSDPPFTIPSCITAPDVNSLSASCSSTNPNIASFSWSPSQNATSATYYILTFGINTKGVKNIDCSISTCGPVVIETAVGEYNNGSWKVQACNSLTNCSQEVDGSAFTCNPPAYLKTTGGDVHSNK